MPYKPVYYKWEWDLVSPPEILWPLAADTNRFDRDTGIPRLNPIPTEERLPNAGVRARLSQYGLPIEYEQEPFEWNYPHFFSVTRNFMRGPLARLSIRANLVPTPAGGTHLTYEVWATPNNLIGLIGIPIQIGFLLHRSFGAAYRKYDQFAAAKTPLQNTFRSIQLFPGARRRLASFRLELPSAGADSHITNRLLETMLDADDLTVSRMRPYEYADYWHTDRRLTLETFLIATRAGLLNFRWDVLCPSCRIAKQTTDTLSGLRLETHCDTCNIDYSTNFARSVEVTFRPNDTIRRSETREFCIGSPTATPHVISQFMLQPGASNTFRPQLEDGRYRIRTFDLPGNQYLRAAPEGSPSLRVDLTPEGWDDSEPTGSLTPEISVTNHWGTVQLFLFERMAWADTAVTGAEIIAMQKFRDLFSHEALRPGERISVGSMAVVFTDLRDSTRLYREIGDAPAFGHVMEHFGIIRNIFVEAEGVLIKTLGDAVMAVFRRPVNALQGAIAAQAELQKITIEGRPVFLKAGIHFGPCIAVTLNGQLDFFGSTVNAASRLESYSTGENIILSDAAFSDPEVQDYIHTHNFTVREKEVLLKGFEGEEFIAWELKTGS